MVGEWWKVSERDHRKKEIEKKPTVQLHVDGNVPLHPVAIR